METNNNKQQPFYAVERLAVAEQVNREQNRIIEAHSLQIASITAALQNLTQIVTSLSTQFKLKLENVNAANQSKAVIYGQLIATLGAVLAAFIAASAVLFG